MKKTRKVFLILCVVVLALTWVGIAQANSIKTLAELVGGETITAGDKLFDTWTITPNNSVVDTSLITVTPVDGGLDPGPGLDFDAFGALTAADGNSLHLQFGFKVTVLDDLFIKDNSLYLREPIISPPPAGRDVNTNLGVRIDETISDAAGNQLGTKRVEYSYLGLDINNIVFSDIANFNPIKEIFVTKDIWVWTNNLGETAGIGQVAQRFSQTPIPEPATMLLLGSGLVGVAGAARRRKKK